MCIAIPGRIKRIDGDQAEIDYGGVAKSACISLFPHAVIGDAVLVHAGFVIQVLDEQSGAELERLIDEAMLFASDET
ncbi:MAG: HypC/HybG/HupF family hydrogenase formation chaperone [Clostridia bacterium]